MRKYLLPHLYQSRDVFWIKPKGHLELKPYVAYVETIKGKRVISLRALKIVTEVELDKDNPKHLKEIKISDIQTSVRLENALRDMELETLYDIYMTPQRDFLRQYGVGRKVISEIHEILHVYGYEWPDHA